MVQLAKEEEKVSSLLRLKGAAVNFNKGDKYGNTQAKVKFKVTAGRVWSGRFPSRCVLIVFSRL